MSVNAQRVRHGVLVAGRLPLKIPTPAAIVHVHRRRFAVSPCVCGMVIDFAKLRRKPRFGFAIAARTKGVGGSGVELVDLFIADPPAPARLRFGFPTAGRVARAIQVQKMAARFRSRTRFDPNRSRAG